MFRLCVVWTLAAVGAQSASFSLQTNAFLPPTIGRKNPCIGRSSHVDSSRRAAASSPSEDIRYIAGRRALLIRPPDSSSSDHPPLVILGGMAQSIASWEFHLPNLSRHRTVLVYEALGQGPPPPDEILSLDGKEVALERYYDNVTLERQGNDFWDVIDEAFGTKEKVDVAGFSFGGRLAMAAASVKSNRIRRLHLTGVGAEREELANVILASWKEMLGSGNDEVEMGEEECTSRLRSFAWSIILATYSDEMLASSGPERVSSWVDAVCRHNTQEGLRAIAMQTHDGAGSMWTPAAMAERMQSSNAIERYRIVVGSQDKMATPAQAKKLAKLLQANEVREDETFNVIEGCGHAVPMETMRVWREDVLGFLNSE